MSTQPEHYSTRESYEFRSGRRRPEWIQQLPWLRFPPLDSEFQLIDPYQLRSILENARTEDAQRVREDIQFLEIELMRLFRERDYDAKFQLNRYKLYQIFYAAVGGIMILLTILMVWDLNQSALFVPFLGFGGTALALTMIYLSSIAGRESTLQLYIQSRRRAEELRREYFRYLMNMPPYDESQSHKRRMLLSMRTADINRGVFPGA